MAKSAKIQLDKERTFRYPLYSLIQLEEVQGVKLSDLSDEEKAKDLKTILSLIWAGLIHEDKDLTIEDVGNMIDISELSEVSQVMTSVLNSSVKKV